MPSQAPPIANIFEDGIIFMVVTCPTLKRPVIEIQEHLKACIGKFDKQLVMDLWDILVGHPFGHVRCNAVCTWPAFLQDRVTSLAQFLNRMCIGSYTLEAWVRYERRRPDYNALKALSKGFDMGHPLRTTIPCDAYCSVFPDRTYAERERSGDSDQTPIFSMILQDEQRASECLE